MPPKRNTLGTVLTAGLTLALLSGLVRPSESAPAPRTPTARDVLQKFGARDFGAKGDGSHDDTAALQAAVNACQAAGGGEVYLAPGTYRLTASVNITAPNVQVVGAGGGATILQAAFASGDVLHAAPVSPPPAPYTSGGLTGLRFSDFAVQSAAGVTRTSGAGIFADFSQGCVVERVTMGAEDINAGDTLPLYDGIVLKDQDTCVVRAVRLYTRHYGVELTGYQSSFAANGQLATFAFDGWVGGGSVIYGNNASGSAGVYLGGSCGGVQVEETDIGHYETGLSLDSGVSGAGNRELFVGHCFIDASGGRGIQIADNAATLVHLNCSWVAGSGRQSGAAGFPSGNLMDVSGTQVSTLRGVITGCRFYSAAGGGLQLSAGQWTVTGCQIDNVGTGTNGGDAIDLLGNMSDCVLTGNTIYAVGNATRGTGINIASGVNHFIVAGNIVHGCGVAPITNNGGTSNVVANNLTY